MTKRLVSILTSLMLLISIFAAIPAQAGSVGEWVFDFKNASNSDGSFTNGSLDSNGKFISNITGWIYNSDGDYVDMNSSEVANDITTSEPITGDYTIGFKLKPGTAVPAGETASTYGANTIIRLRAKGDIVKLSQDTYVSGSDGVIDDVEIYPASIYNFFWIYPGAKKIVVNDYTLTSGKGSDKAFYFDSDEWIDVKYVFDFAQENTDNLLLKLYVYLNDKIASTVELPKERTLSNTTVCLFPDYNNLSGKGYPGDVVAYGVSKLTLKGAPDTLIKDMYVHDGCEFSSSMGKIADNTYIYGGSNIAYLTSAKVNTPLVNKNMGSSYNCDYEGKSENSNGYARVTVKSSTTDVPWFGFETPQETNGHFVYRVKVRFNDFNTVKKFAELMSQSASGGTTHYHSSLLETVVSSSSESKLKLTYYDGGKYVYNYSDIKTNEWYNIEIAADYTSAYPIFEVNVSDTSGEKLFDNVRFEDRKASVQGTGLRFKFSLAASKTEIENLGSNTSVIDVDNLYVSKLSSANKITVDYVKLYQGQDIITASEKFDATKELKVALTVSNNSNSVSAGTLIVAQYGPGNELLDLATSSYIAPAGKNVYTSSFMPGISASSVIFTPDENVSYIKLFVMDSTDNIIPYAKSAKISAK